MEFELIDIDELEPLPNRTSTGLEISDHYVPTDENVDHESGRGPENIGLRVYYVEPGESLGGSMHYHEEQEEIFYVIEGTLHVETPEREYEVNPEQAFIAKPGSPQMAYNPETADETVYLVAIGAPSYRIIGRNDAQPYDPDEYDEQESE